MGSVLSLSSRRAGCLCNVHVLEQWSTHTDTFTVRLSLHWGQSSVRSAPSVVGGVSAGSVARWCAGGGGSCCGGEGGGGGRGSEEPAGRCTEARGCSARRTDTWPPPSAASPPSSGRRSPSPGSHSPANAQGHHVCLLVMQKGGFTVRLMLKWQQYYIRYSLLCFNNTFNSI